MVYMTLHQLQATRKERVLNEDEDDPEGSWEASKQKGPKNQKKKNGCIRSSASINRGGVGGVSESSFGSHYRRPSSVDLGTHHLRVYKGFIKGVEPSSEAVLPANQDFEVAIYAHKIQLGFFTPPASTYYQAPQQLNKKGLIKGHTHLVIQKSVAKRVFETQDVGGGIAFFKGVAEKQVNGIVKLTVKGGLPAGTYRISTLTSAMNHQPVLLPVARRGAVDDAIYIRVGGAGHSTPKSLVDGKALADASGAEPTKPVDNDGEAKEKSTKKGGKNKPVDHGADSSSDPQGEAGAAKEKDTKKRAKTNPADLDANKPAKGPPKDASSSSSSAQGEPPKQKDKDIKDVKNQNH
ncbi:hypothetical protein PGTUg99_011972 [Puccinia graminis f. sp. tritici]|uniref:Uncharacterized protein n=1 Tax=Puccinia graminis f. sp. tritici TaxID=56615 RepID=A0A5B0SIG4_PUCGR|nr:hypothetical protein PGTUg99_011972 [Puccinia graminis f. sp. tritici]